MSVIFSLPDDIVRSLLSEWLDFVQWFRLDCALYGQNNDLIVILKTLAYPRLMSDLRKSNFISLAMHNWSRKRKIKFSSVDSNDLEFLTYRDYEEIVLLSFLPDFSGKAHLIANLCPKLRELRLCVKQPNLDKFKPVQLQNLTWLFIHFPKSGFTSDINKVAPIAQHCVNLRYISLSPNCIAKTGTSTVLVKIITNNPNLTNIDFGSYYADNSVFLAIETHCSELKSLYLTCEPLAVNFGVLARACKRLKLKDCIVSNLVALFNAQSLDLLDTLWRQDYTELLEALACNGLQSLTLTEINNIPPAVIQRILTYSSETLLSYVSKRCTYEEAGIEEVLSRCSRLRDITIR